MALGPSSEEASGGLNGFQVALVVGVVALLGLAVLSVTAAGESTQEPQDDEAEVWMDGA